MYLANLETNIQEKIKNSNCTISSGLDLEPTKVTIEEVLEILKNSSKIEVHTELSKIFSTTFEEVKTQKEKNNSTTSNAKTQTCP